MMTGLHVGMLEQDLAVCFELSQLHVSIIMTTLVKDMFHNFKEIEIWPMREQSLANIVEKVREFCPTLGCITDATEIYIEQSKNPEAPIQLTGGSISDRDLKVKSGILDKDWAKVDVLMAYHGFEIQDDLAPMDVKLNIPPFLKGQCHAIVPSL